MAFQSKYFDDSKRLPSRLPLVLRTNTGPAPAAGPACAGPAAAAMLLARAVVAVPLVAFPWRDPYPSGVSETVPLEIYFLVPSFLKEVLCDHQIFLLSHPTPGCFSSAVETCPES